MIPIIIGSKSDMPLANKIKQELHNVYRILSVVRICSAHKACLDLVKMLDQYVKTDIQVYITIAGKSNALSSLVDGYVPRPVISCPPITHETMYDIYSSISLPSHISPMTVLGYKNCALAAAKVYSLQNCKVLEYINRVHQQNRLKLKVDDIIEKYNNHDDLIKRRLTEINKLGSENNPNSIYNGKVRSLIPFTDNTLNMVASDRLSAFDTHICNIPYKGEIINEISCWWFNKTKEIIPNHLINLSGNERNTMLVKKCKVFPIEIIVRAYMTGSTSTSIWMNYKNGVRNYCGHSLPDGMVKNQALPKLLITPTTKGVTDELIDEEWIVKNVMEKQQWEYISQKALELFKFGQETMLKNGLILVDTKYEFGLSGDGDILLVDELHTPDSSRYWLHGTYESNLKAGKEPDNIDKEYLRKWIKSNFKKQDLDVYKDKNEISNLVSKNMIVETSRKYMQLYELITQKEFNPHQ